MVGLGLCHWWLPIVILCHLMVDAWQGTTGRTSPLELHCLPWRLGGWWIFFFRLPERLVTKLASLGCSFRWSLWLTFWPSCDFSFVEAAAAGTGALYIGDMTNGRLIRWPIGAKQGEKPKLNFHGWSSYPFNVPPARNEGLIAGLNSPDHKTLFLGGVREPGGWLVD